MPAANRQKKSTVASQVKMMASIQSSPDAPMSLNDNERSHFVRVTISRENQSFSAHDLALACLLAKAMARLEQISAQLDRDGVMLTNGKGTQIAHPLLAAAASSAQVIQALSRSLGLSASQRGLSGAPQAKRNQAEMAMRRDMEEAMGDDLLARPS